MPRPQFGLKTMLWTMAVMAAFLAGRTVGIEGERRRLDAEMSAMRAWVERERNSVSEEMNEMKTPIFLGWPSDLTDDEVLAKLPEFKVARRPAP